MANNYFQFKQFTIHQDRCAMKVTTDACLFGAVLAKQLGSATVTSRALDIGTGTGLLSLMLAQYRPDLEILALEIDEAAAGQAGENFSASPWKDKLRVIHADVLDVEDQAEFDLVFSNPPFYENELSSPDQRINLARHNNDLPLSLLIGRIKELLAEKGQAWLLLPFKRRSEFRQCIAKQRMAMGKLFLVRNKADDEPFRFIVQIRNNQFIEAGMAAEEIVIFEKQGGYTKAFTELLSPYYLRL